MMKAARKTAAGPCCRPYHSGFGTGVILFRTSPFALVEVKLPREGLLALAAAFGPESADGAGESAEALRVIGQLEAYLKGELKTLLLPPLDWGRLTDLERAVLEATAAIPFGTVSTYRRIAAEVGRPRASRFVGNVLAKNPFPLLIPCHRVIRSDGSLGGFGGGSRLKTGLLAMEGMVLPRPAGKR